MMQLMSATIHLTWEVQKACPKLTWIKWSSPGFNLAKGCSSPTLVHPRSGKFWWWRGFSGWHICPLYIGRTDSDKFEMDLWYGKLRLKSFWWHSRHGFCWWISIMLNGFASSGWRCFWKMWKGNSTGEEQGEVRQQATGDGVGRACGQKCGK